MNEAPRRPTTYEARRATICEQASHWADKFVSGELSATDQAALDAWLEESPAHRLEYELTLGLLEDDLLTRALEAAAATDRVRQPTSPWESLARALRGAVAPAAAVITAPRLGAAVAGAGAVAVAALLWVPSETPTPSSSLAAVTYETAAGQSQTITPPDLSTITLNGSSSLRVAYSPAKRMVYLDRGDAVFAVTSDAARPFIAQANHAQVTVVGTEFAISQSDRGTIVEVTEGKVRVAPTVGPAVYLEPGEGARVSFGAIQRWTFELDERQDWRTGWISTTSMPLAHLSEVMSRRTGTPVVIEGAAAHLEVAGRFRIDEPEVVLKRIAGAFELHYSQAADGTITVQPSTHP